MLQQMRKWSGYLKWLLVVVVFMFIVWGFATWTGGVGGSGARAADDWAANVNGTVIEGNEFRTRARRLDSYYQQMFGEQYQQQRAFVRVGRTTIGQMIEDELILQAARAEGLQVSQQE